MVSVATSKELADIDCPEHFTTAADVTFRHVRSAESVQETTVPTPSTELIARGREGDGRPGRAPVHTFL